MLFSHLSMLCIVVVHSDNFAALEVLLVVAIKPRNKLCVSQSLMILSVPLKLSPAGQG